MNTALVDVAVPSTRVGRILLVVALVVSAVVGSRGISSDAAVSLQGDMARYLMDGVFFHDLVRSGLSWSPHAMFAYAERYYARYPALSVGHHPPLLPLALAPFFGVFGVSIAAARVVMLIFFFAAVLLLYALGRRLYDEGTAGWACVLFASNGAVGSFGQVVLSEMPAIALVLAALIFLDRFRVNGRGRDYALLIVFTMLTLLTREVALFVFPAYAILVCLDGGWRHLRRPRILFWTAVGGALTAAAGVAMLVFSPYNLSVIRYVFAHGLGAAVASTILRQIAREQLGPALLSLTVLGIVVSALTRDRRIIFGIVWFLSVLAGVVFVTGVVEPTRYSILAVPAYCLCAAATWACVRPGALRAVMAVVLTAGTGWQLVSARHVVPVVADGYEEAAEFVVSQRTDATVLFSGAVDTGYFVFFVREHDPAQRLVVLRSDKMLTTSLMGDVAEENRISTPSQIYDVLDRFGTRFVVIEDRPTGSVVLDWLRDELRTNRFVERRRFPTESTDRRLRGVDIVVYEYLGARPPASDAELDLKLPVVGREIRVPLADLLSAKPGDRR